MIIRVAKDTNPFAQIARACLEDRNLSWKARGLLAYLLSKPDGWEVHSHQLIRASEHDKKTAVQAGMAELVKFGYARLETVRGEKGHVRGKQYVVAEAPVFLSHRETGFPSLGKTRETGKPTIGKTDDRETCSISNKESESKKEKAVRVRKNIPPALAPKAPEIYTPGFVAFWEAYPKTRRKGKAETWQIWRRDNLEIRSTEIVEKVAALVRYDHDWIKGFSPEPHRWLKNKCYEDDILTESNAPMEGELLPSRSQQRNRANVQSTLDLEERLNGHNGANDVRAPDGPARSGLPRGITRIHPARVLARASRSAY